MKYNVRISNIKTDGAIKAYASVNLNEEFAITGVKIMEGTKGIFVSMPNYKTSKGEYKDICFPITKEARENFEKAVLDSYKNAIEKIQSKTQKLEDTPIESQEMSGM